MNEDIKRVRIYEIDHKPDAFPAVEMSLLSRLADRVEGLEHALLSHRSDLHLEGKRPCPTCRESATVLGLNVPLDRCANATLDRRALMEDPRDGKSLNVNEMSIFPAGQNKA